MARRKTITLKGESAGAFLRAKRSADEGVPIVDKLEYTAIAVHLAVGSGRMDAAKAAIQDYANGLVSQALGLVKP